MDADILRRTSGAIHRDDVQREAEEVLKLRQAREAHDASIRAQAQADMAKALRMKIIMSALSDVAETDNDDRWSPSDLECVAVRLDHMLMLIVEASDGR